MQVNQKKIFNWESYFGLFSADFWFWAEVKKVTNRAKLKILLLELWLEPTRLGLITNIYVLEDIQWLCGQQEVGRSLGKWSKMAYIFCSHLEYKLSTLR